MRLHFAVLAGLLVWCIPGKCIFILIFYEAFGIFSVCSQNSSTLDRASSINRITKFALAYPMAPLNIRSERDPSEIRVRSERPSSARPLNPNRPIQMPVLFTVCSVPDDDLSKSSRAFSEFCFSTRKV